MEEQGDVEMAEVTDGELACICYCYPGQDLYYAVAYPTLK